MRKLALTAALLAGPLWTVPTQPLGYPLIPTPGSPPAPPPPVYAPARPGLPPTLPLGYPLIPPGNPTNPLGSR